LGAAAAAQTTSPRVSHLYQLLADLNPAQRDSTARLWMLRAHPDKPGANPDEFIAIKLALDLHRNGPPPNTTTGAEPLALTYPAPTRRWSKSLTDSRSQPPTGRCCGDSRR
jgi:hypothetical protein